MKKITLEALFIACSLIFLGSFQSCQNDFQNENDAVENKPIEIRNNDDIYTFSSTELDQMTDQLNEDGVTIDIDSTELQTRGIFLKDIFVKAVKVSCKTPSPKNDGSYVDMSGVLLIPKKIPILSHNKKYRLMVVTPFTYTSNAEAPSNLFQRMSLINTHGSLNSNKWNINAYYFFTLQAKAGYAVLIPDYLGFGDSYKECVHPYLEVKPMVQSIMDLIQTAKSTLTARGYAYKKEMVVTGYSLGGFIAASLTRKLETEYPSMPVNLLFTGGTPCNLKQIVDIVRQSETLAHSYFIPYAIWGFKQNNYPQINLSTIMKEPYASTLGQIFDGAKNVDNSYFSTKVADVYTENFIKNLDTDHNLSYINDILIQNS